MFQQEVLDVIRKQDKLVNLAYGRNQTNTAMDMHAALIKLVRESGLCLCGREHFGRYFDLGYEYGVECVHCK